MDFAASMARAARGGSDVSSQTAESTDEAIAPSDRLSRGIPAEGDCTHDGVYQTEGGSPVCVGFIRSAQRVADNLRAKRVRLIPWLGAPSRAPCEGNGPA